LLFGQGIIAEEEFASKIENAITIIKENSIREKAEAIYSKYKPTVK